MALRQGKYVDTTPFLSAKTTIVKGGAFVGQAGDTIINETLVYYVLNRGRNTGAGDAYVYWTSPEHVDTAGTYYPPSGKPPWGQITDVIGVGLVKTILP